MVVNRGDIKRKRKDDSCFSMLDESPKRTKVHAQRKFAQGSNVSSPVITPVKEIERQERNRDVLPEPIELLPMKRPNTEDFLTFLCFRGTPILPPNLNFFNAASMMDSSLRNSEPKTTYPKNGPILTSSPSKCQNEKPFVAFGVRKRADPIVISKQMDRKRRHALALQALRRKYQEQKMAKIRAVTISKLSEKVTNKNVVRTRSVTKNEIASKKSIMHKTNIKVISTKRITTKTAINKQPVKSKMCLRSFRGRYIHRELNIKTHRKRGPQQRVPPPKLVEKSSSEFSSDDDEPLMKSVKEKPPKKQAATAQKLKKTIENTIRLTRSHNKLLQKVQSQQRKQTLKHRRIITRLSSTMTPSNQRIKSKIVQSSSNIIRNLRKSVNNIKRSGNQNLTQVIRSTRQRIVKNTTEKSVQTRSKSDRTIKEKEEPPKKIEANLPKRDNQVATATTSTTTLEKIEKPPASIKSGDDKINKPKPLGEKSKPPPSNEKNVKVKTKEAEQSPGPSPGKRKVDTIKKAMQKIGNSRPSRKTKEAAAIYMELLGHKLVNDTEVDDDDESIDSFPELPNVRRTEQRENELKAKAKSKDVKEDVKDALPVKKVDKIESAKAGDKMEVKDPMPAKKAPIQEQKCQKSTSPTEKINVVPSSDVEVSPAKIEESKDVKEVDSIGDSLKTPVKTVKRQLSVTESDIDKAMALVSLRITIPYVYLTRYIYYQRTTAAATTTEDGREVETRLHEKVGHNYLPFSSSDDEEKYFHGFKTELKSSKIGGNPTASRNARSIRRCLRPIYRARISDAAATDLFPENMIKTEDKNLISGKSAANRENDESLSLNSSTPEKNTIQATPTPPKITPTSERKTIFKKERSEPVRNVNAFSASNECSVYAFEADTEDSTSISTPFRRPCRRPSSTATSRSEDDAKIIDDISKHSTGKFRFPAVLRGDYKILNRQDSATGQPIQEDSTTQSTNLDVHTFTDTSNSEPPSIIEDISDQQIFCASTSSSTGQQQPNKNQSPPDIACAKVILGKTLLPVQKKTMFPPAMLHKGKNDDVRYKVPSSPSASSSSSAKLVNKRQTGKTRNRLPEAAYTQVVNVAEFPNPQAQQVRHQAQIVEAPCFHPTEKEFQDPLDYIEKIRARAEKFGICRIIPPANFKPECKVSDDMRFTAYNQYVNKLLHRWGPNFRS
ncbi:lysine-specific demethylase [Holotrichia oblita]|uniref:Lysine-specific demethylase n=1 Tax=Holotrichia oblita TaxID=644536 RepID=A0ACB9TYK6_HOLOL|nr:lysine-specific demethylase [Holotrichia oblita]